MSPTQLTLKRLREMGYYAQVVEHYNAFAKIRQDLFGGVDVLALGEGRTLAVQCTSKSNMASRVKKLRALPVLPFMRSCRWELQVWGWAKSKKTRKYELFIEGVLPW